MHTGSRLATSVGDVIPAQEFATFLVLGPMVQRPGSFFTCQGWTYQLRGIFA